MLQRFAAVCFVIVGVLALSAGCGGGGGGNPATIVSINLNPSVAIAGGVMELTASISAPGRSVSNMIKNWTVSAGTLSASAPQFNLQIRQTAQDIGSSVSTTSNSVYWTAPVNPGTASITLQIDGDSETITTNVATSPITFNVTSGENGTKTVTVRANNVSDLYYAAFRISHSSNWIPASADQGDFLGSVEQTLFIGLTNQTGFVPVAISKRGDAAGEDGSGTLATITFNSAQAPPAEGSSASSIPFGIEGVVLENSAGKPILSAY